MKRLMQGWRALAVSLAVGVLACGGEMPPAESRTPTRPAVPEVRGQEQGRGRGASLERTASDSPDAEAPRVPRGDTSSTPSPRRETGSASPGRSRSGASATDTLPPVLSLRVPATAPELVTHSPYVLRGTVGDESGEARVRVQGNEVPVLAGGFLAAVPLKAGDNILFVQAWDEAGNQTQRTHVVRVASLPPQVTILSPLSGSESPNPEAKVRVRATSATSSIARVWVSEREAVQTRPGEYEATYSLRLGDNTIEVRAVDEAGLSASSSVQVNFRSASREPLAVTGVSPPRGAVGVEPDSIISVAFNKPVRWESLEEHFTVHADGKRLEGGYSLAPGGQTAMFLSSRPLPERARLTVRVEGVEPREGPGLTAGFSSDFTLRGALTRVRGYVTDAEFQPLPGVEVTLEGRGLSTRTGPDGNWALFVPEGGPVVVRYEGGLGAAGELFPRVRRRLLLTTGAETVDAPLRLTPTDGASAQWVAATDGSDLTFGGRQPGLRVTRTAGGALRFEDGKTAEAVTATWLPNFLLPVPREGRGMLGGVWQLGPAGLRSDTPVTFTLPNLTPGLPDGRYAVLLAYDPHRQMLARVGFGRVRDEGRVIATETPLRLESLEFLAYVPLSSAQHDAVARVLGTGGTPAEGGAWDGGSPSDGGLGWLQGTPGSPARPWWKRSWSSLVLGEAHAQTADPSFQLALSTLDSQGPGTVAGLVQGTVRAPMDMELVFSLLAPSPNQLTKIVRWEKGPFTLPVSFRVEHIQRAEDATLKGKARALLEVYNELGQRVPSPSGEKWDVEGDREALVSTVLTFTEAKATKLKLLGSSPAGLRVLELTATLKLEGQHGASLTLKREPGSTALGNEVAGPIRFKHRRVTVTGPAAGGAATTGEKGTYGVVVPLIGAEETGISCTEIPLANKVVERLGEDGTPRYDKVLQQFGVCSELYSVSKDGAVADILVDARVLAGELSFVKRTGEELPARCSSPDDESELDDTHRGEYKSIAPKDVASTEIHFFREDDLEHPIAIRALGEADPRKCSPPSNGQAAPAINHGLFSRLRLGPTNDSKRYARQRCLDLEQSIKDKTATPADKAYYEANCQGNRTNFMNLASGDRLVVFAINQATGYAGMKRVTVPSVNVDGSAGRAADGSCLADQGKAPLEVTENGQTYELSRCTQQQLAIDVGTLKLYPPEIDLRVSRKMESQGSRKQTLQSLIRQGGSATTNDEHIAVSMQWRVRVKPFTASAATSPGAAVPCQTTPCVLEDPQGLAGQRLEVYCSELPANASADARETCVKQDPPLLDVPAGVPPLAGRLIKVTGSAQEEPLVKIFPVRSGGRFTEFVHLAEQYQTASSGSGAGDKKIVNALPRANYYLHVVGVSVADRDTNQDDVIQPGELNNPPPNFSAEEAPTEGDEAGRIPTHALGLKNVYRHIEPDGAKVERFDSDREHAFRVLDLQKASLEAKGRNPSEELTTQPTPSASPDDTSYAFLLHLLEPDGAEDFRSGRMKKNPNESYVVRLGGDGFGIECPINVAPASNGEPMVLSGSCGGDSLSEILSADDVLYFELYLSGNAENILYRFNFEGLSTRTDYLSASHDYTLTQSQQAPELSGGAAAPGREISQPPMANFSVKQANFTEGEVSLSVRKPNSPAVKLARVNIKLKADGSGWDIQNGQVEGAPDKVRFSYDEEPSNGAWSFHAPLPSALASMEGSAQNANSAIWVTLTALKPKALTVEYNLGNPLGAFAGVNAAAREQNTASGVNIADGHLSFTHTDFTVPTGVGAVGFNRTYNNQNNLLTPMGLGWSHNYDGWVLEETYQNRYVVVLGGQAYPFPGCEVPPEGAPAPVRVRCLADTSHNNVLYVRAPLDRLSSTAPPNASIQPHIEMWTDDGRVYRFRRPAQREERAGRRKWLLTEFGERREAGTGEAGTGEVELKGNRAVITYRDDSDLVQEVSSSVAQTQLLFSYQAVDTATAPTRVKVLSGSRGFKWLSRVELKNKASLRILYQVDFKRDTQGNLTHAMRTQWKWDMDGTSLQGPFPLWSYAYAPIPEGLVGEERWNASNELKQAQLIYSATPKPDGDTWTPPTSPVQWWATYARGTTALPYPHLKPYEVVAQVTMSGQQSQPLVVSYTSATSRSVTSPEGVTTQVGLNAYGSVNQMTPPIPGTASTTRYQNDQTGSLSADAALSKPVMVESAQSAMGLKTTVVPKTGSDPFDALQAAQLQFSALLPGTSVPGVPAGASVALSYENSVKKGVPTGKTLPGAKGPMTWAMPANQQGSLQSLKVTGPDDTKTLMSGAQYDGDGRLTSVAQDEQGRSVVLAYDSAVFGLLHTQTFTLPTEQVAEDALGTLLRTFTYDAYGRRTGIKDSQTSAEEAWSYDGLGRVRTHSRSGTPVERWDYTYVETDKKLTVHESLAQSRDSRDPTPQHTRTSVFDDGLLVRESYLVGAPAVGPGAVLPTAPEFSTVSREYSYVNGRLETVTDERNIRHTNVYDANGRLSRVEVGSPGNVEQSFTYDADGRVTRIKNLLQRETVIKYDALGRAVAWDYGSGDVEGVTLDIQGTPIKTWWGVGETTRTEVSKLDALGRPVETKSATKPGNVLVTETRDTAGRVISRVDGVLGLEDVYEYKDVLGRLTRHQRKVRSSGTIGFVDTLLNVETRKYNDVAHTVSIQRNIATGLSAPAARTESETWTLDTAGRVLKTERMLAGIGLSQDEYKYNERGQLRWHRDAKLAITQYFHDPMGNLVQVLEPGDQVATSTLKTTYLLHKDGRRWITAGPHPEYGVEETYDDFGELESRTIRGADTTPSSTWTYSRTGQPGEIKEIAPDLTHKIRTVNARGRLVGEEVSRAGGRQKLTVTLDGPYESMRSFEEGTWSSTRQTLERDDLGRSLDEAERWSAQGLGYTYRTKTAWTGRTATVESIWTTSAGSAEPPTSDTQRRRTMELTLDSLGNVVRRKAQGQTSPDLTLYDASGLLSKEQPAGRPATVYTYDQGLLRSSDYEGEQTTYVYNLTGQLTLRTDPDQRSHEYERSFRGNVLSEVHGRLLSGVWEAGAQRTAYEYDPQSGHLTRVYQGSQTSDERYAVYKYGARGELLSVRPGNGVDATFDYAYDASNRLKSVKVLPRLQFVAQLEFAYDFAGRLTERKRTSTTFGGTTSMTWVTTHDNGESRTKPSVSQEGDTLGEVVQLVDGRGRIARTQYIGTATTSTYQDLFAVDNEYNGADQPLSVVESRLGNTTIQNTFAYDSRGLLTTLARSGGSSNEVLNYQYTESGQRSSVSMSSSSSSSSIGYTYDRFDRLYEIIPASGSRVPTKVSWEAGGARLKSVGDNVLVQERCYDSVGRLSAVINSTGGDLSCANPFYNAAMAYEYTYDGRGNRLTERSGGSEVAVPGLTRYGYDGADRLSGVRYPDGSAMLYSLGADGRRLGEKRVTNYADNAPLTPDAFARITSSDPDLERHWAYKYDGLGGLSDINDASSNTAVFNFDTDRFGQVRSKTDSLERTRTTYSWDPAGRLAKVSRPNSVDPQNTDEYTFKYDYAGLRRSRTSNNGSPAGAWLYAGEELVAEGELTAGRGPRPTPILALKMYERVGDLVTAFNNDRIMTDGLGSAVGRLNSSTHGFTPYQYDAWGEYPKGTARPKSGEGSLGYTGHLWDNDADLVYAQQRWYSPQTGRFLSEDPMGAAAYLMTPTELNPWLYTRGNPMKFTDPDGRSSYCGADASGFPSCDFMQPVAQWWGMLWEGAAGGQSRISGSGGNYTMSYEGPRNGVGGFIGGYARAMSLRTIPIEDYPSWASLEGMEMGAGYASYVDPATRLITGETVTGREASRAEAALEVLLDFGPPVLEGATSTWRASRMARKSFVGEFPLAKLYRERNVAHGPLTSSQTYDHLGSQSVRGVTEFKPIPGPGQRQSAHNVLEPDVIETLKKEFAEVGGDPSKLRFNSGNQTGYLQGSDVINVRGDVLPVENAAHPRSAMSTRAVLAHERGHSQFPKTKLPHNDWRDEFRASYWAAKYAPNLSWAERSDLIRDAIKRAEETPGVSIKENPLMRYLRTGQGEPPTWWKPPPGAE